MTTAIIENIQELLAETLFDERNSQQANEKTAQ
jgi:hypothetical protein